MSIIILGSYNFTPKELTPYPILFQKINYFRLRRRHPWESVRGKSVSHCYNSCEMFAQFDVSF